MTPFNLLHPTMKSPRVPLTPFTCLAHGCSLLMCALLLILNAPSGRAAAVPENMTYQGFLVDGNGGPLATNAPANYPVIFRIYDAPTSGNVKWAESQIVTVDRGSFSVQLGEGNPVGSDPRPSLSTVFSGTAPDQRYMELTVTLGSSSVTLLPRLRLLPAPYAFQAASAAGLVTPAGVKLFDTTTAKVVGDGSGLTNLDASKITLGTLNPNLLTNIDAGRITVGTLNTNRVPNLDASKITSGILLSNLIPANLGSHMFSGNVGIGTNNPAAKLHVVGDVNITGTVRVGSGGTESLATGLESVRIVRGRVGSLGEIRDGTGFTAGLASTNVGQFTTIYSGPYTLKFNPPFSSAPVITVTPHYTEEVGLEHVPIASVGSVTAESAKVYIYKQKDQANQISVDFKPTIQSFSFIAIGPR